MYKSGRVVAPALILFALQDLSLSQPFCWRVKCCGVLSRFLRYGGWQCLCLQGQDRLTLKMKALPSFETSTYRAKLRNSPEDSSLQCCLVCLCDTVPIWSLSRRTAGTYHIFCTDRDVNARACSHVCPLS